MRPKRVSNRFDRRHARRVAQLKLSAPVIQVGLGAGAWRGLFDVAKPLTWHYNKRKDTATMSVPVATTPRLILRAFSQEDIDPLHRILSQEGVLRYFPKTDPPPRDRVEKMVLGQLKHWEEHGYGLWAVALR